MCDPVSIGIGGLALGAGTAAMGYSQADKAHKAQRGYNRRLEAQNEAAKEGIKASAQKNAETLARRLEEERLSVAEQIEASQRSALAQKGLLNVFAGAAGWKGRTLDALRSEVEGASMDDQFQLLRNERFLREQKDREVAALMRDAEMGILSLPQPTPSIRPSPAAYGLQALSSGLDAYGRFILPTQLAARNQRLASQGKIMPAIKTGRVK